VPLPASPLASASTDTFAEPDDNRIHSATEVLHSLTPLSTVTLVNPRIARDARGAIVEAASAVFSERGIDGISMRQIAAEIGVSAPALYHHFENKDALVMAACEAGFEEFGAELAAAARGAETPLAGLRASAVAYVDFALHRPMHYDVMMIRPHQWALGPHPSEDPPSFAGLVSLVEACQASCEFAPGDAREAAHQIWAALHGVASLAISLPGDIAGLDAEAVHARAVAVTEALIASFR
jgi:AcrR family transcriptional regulator